MSTQVAFLRAINVAGHAIVKMADLNGAFVSAGCGNVQTVIQSGNVLFDCADSASSETLQEVQRRLAKLVGREVTMTVRTKGEIDEIVRQSPFKAYESNREIKCYVALLAAKPLKKPSLPLRSDKEALEVLKADGRNVFVLSYRLPNRKMYGFPNGVVEAEFGVPATTRNWSTIRKIAGLLSV
jgi:uncharacterized protein (DUF1697 family)